MTAVIYVPDLEEFLPVVETSREAGYAVREPVKGYWRIEAEDEIRLRRKALGLGPALWNSALIGGIVGRIAAFDKDEMIIRGVE
ncbi:hypothetical protein KOAAANKH_00788 [Brevundimonas sp. NIBR10]|uniref:hypothetical protein n=1 Tax=Brevundimonas sp. NIBR10 TaxID=3015997 RepID=UPI0022F1CAC2|nr:hypothetical protein [Brevundimonas sp. NIBR10]WGM45923.1 hypothetical protein KOAAANKH_00788 [Brevundimonas sp. NIBR10]